MATKTTSTARRRSTTPQSTGPRRLPVVYRVRSGAAAKEVIAAVNKLVDGRKVQALTFEEAGAFLAGAGDWSGPGVVFVMPR